MFFSFEEKDDQETTDESDPYTFSNSATENENSALLNKSRTIELSSLRVLDLFQKIPNNVVYLLNMQPDLVHPRDLLVTHVIVPPVNIRPTVDVGAGKTNEDDLTVKIYELYNTNKLIEGYIAEGVENSK